MSRINRLIKGRTLRTRKMVGAGIIIAVVAAMLLYYSGIAFAVSVTVNGTTATAGGTITTPNNALAADGTNKATVAFDASQPASITVTGFSGTAPAGAKDGTIDDVVFNFVTDGTLSSGSAGNDAIYLEYQRYSGDTWQAVAGTYTTSALPGTKTVTLTTKDGSNPWTWADLANVQMRVRTVRSGGADSNTWKVDALHLTVNYTPDATEPNFTVSYYQDSGFTTPLPTDGTNPLAKAGTVYIKIVSDDTMKTNPTVNITSPNGANNVTNGATTNTDGGIMKEFRYAWTVGGGGDGLTAVKITGTNDANLTSTDQVPPGNPPIIDTTAPTLSLQYLYNSDMTALPTVSGKAYAKQTTVYVKLITSETLSSTPGDVRLSIDALPVGLGVGANDINNQNLTWDGANSAWKYTWTVNSGNDGDTNSISVSGKDLAGNTTTGTPSSGSVVRIDTVAPTVTLTAPTAGEYIGGTYNVTGTANDSANFDRYLILRRPNSGGSWVTMYTDSTPVAVSGTVYSWNTTQTTDGDYDVQSVVYDRANNWVASPVVSNVHLDNNPPSPLNLYYYSNSGLTDLLPVVGGRVYAKQGNVYIKMVPNETLKNVANANEISIDAPGAANDVSNADFTLSGSDWVYTWNVQSGNDGDTVSVQVKATDTAGNVRPLGAPDSGGLVRIDTIAPTVSISSPASGSYLTGQIPVTGTADDTNFDSYLVRRRPAGGASWTTMYTGSSPVVGSTVYSWDTTLTADGDYDVQSVVYDKANNWTAGNIVSNLHVDNTPPAIAVAVYSDAGLTTLLPLDGNPATTAPAIVYVKMTPAETLSSSPTISIDAPGLLNDLIDQPTTPNGGSYVYTWNIVQDTDGLAGITVTGFDVAGNEGTGTKTVKIDTDGPTLSLEYYSDSALTTLLPTTGGKPTVVMPGNIYVKLVADETLAGTAGDHKLTINAPPTAALNEANDVDNQNFTWDAARSAWVYTWNVSGGNDGDTLSISVTGKDVAGNTTTGTPASGSVVNIDLTPRPTTLIFTASPASVLANNSDTSELTAHLHDQYGNDMDGWQITFTKNKSWGTLSATTKTTGGADGSGNAKVTITSALTGVVTITASVNGASVSNTAAVEFRDPDFTAPTLSGIAEATSKQLIYLSFSERIRITTSANWIIQKYVNDIYSSTVTLSAYELVSSDNRIVRLTINDPVYSTVYGNVYPIPTKFKVVVSDVYDLNNNQIDTVSKYAYWDAFTPHGKYGRTYPVSSGNSTRMCGLCHKAHGAPGRNLLSGATIKKVCFVCHGTIGISAYKVEKEFYNWNDSNVGAGIYSTSMHKALDAENGGNNVLTCVDCHDPHGIRRSGADIWPKLLRARNVYGVVYTSVNGNWFCLACHGFGDNGRFGASFWSDTFGDHSGGMTVNSNIYNAAHYDPRFSVLLPGSETNITCIKCHERHGSTQVRLVDNVYSDYSTNPAKLCYKCHNTGANNLTKKTVSIATYFAKTYKHDIDNASYGGFSCRSCHEPHSVAARTYANSGSGAPSDLSNPENTFQNVYKGSGIDDTTFCLKCHKVANGPALTQTLNATTLIPYDVTMPGTGNWDKRSFTSSGHYAAGASCGKCHDPHGSDYPGMTNKPEDTNQNGMCLQCHSGSGSPAGPNVWTNGIGATYKHNILGTTGTHSGTESTAVGWNKPGVNRHVECGDCHDPHSAQSGNHTPGGNGDKGAVLNGAWGITVNLGTEGSGNDYIKGNGISQLSGKNLPSYSFTSAPTKEYQVCLKCHSTYAWGSVSYYQSSATAPASSWPGSIADTQTPSAGSNGVGKQPDIAAQFHPANYAYHPLFVAGLNQPSDGANSAWTGAGKKTSAPNTGFDNTFVDGWGKNSLVTCTDCHASDSASSPRGPHGSANKWMLKGLNPNVTINGSTTVNQGGWNSGYAAVRANFCVNCHRADVYGFGSGQYSWPATAYENFARFDHQTGGGVHPADCTLPNSSLFAGEGSGNKIGTGCFNCHGSREPGGIHGTSMGVGVPAAANDPRGKRFINGASWAGYKKILSTQLTTCYTSLYNLSFSSKCSCILRFSHCLKQTIWTICSFMHKTG